MKKEKFFLGLMSGILSMVFIFFVFTMAKRAGLDLEVAMVHDSGIREFREYLSTHGMKPMDSDMERMVRERGAAMFFRPVDENDVEDAVLLAQRYSATAEEKYTAKIYSLRAAWNDWNGGMCAKQAKKEWDSMKARYRLEHPHMFPSSPKKSYKTLAADKRSEQYDKLMASAEAAEPEKPVEPEQSEKPVVSEHSDKLAEPEQSVY